MRFLTAEKVFDGIRYLPEGTVLVLNDQNLLSDILSPGLVESSRVEKLEGILTPGFVNAHCHLELSHLERKITKHTGLPGFAMELMAKRNLVNADEAREMMSEADRQMSNNGIVLVGDIANSAESIFTKTRSRIFYHSYVELIGLNPDYANLIFDKGKELMFQFQSEGLRASLAPHAPFSVSTQLVELISQLDKELQMPVTIHNQESEAEENFLMGRKSGINALYEFLKLDISYFKAPEMNSLELLANKISSRPRTFVHNTFSQKKDIDAHSDQNTFWCFCPAANAYIENRLPDFDQFAGKNICVGTDSLASNEELNLITEANLILANSQFEVTDLLRAMTFNGASALGLQDQFGLLKKGIGGGINLVSVKNKNICFQKRIC